MTPSSNSKNPPDSIPGDRTKECPSCKGVISKASTTCKLCGADLYGRETGMESTTDVLPFYFPPMVILAGFIFAFVSGAVALIMIFIGFFLFRRVRRFLLGDGVRIPISVPLTVLFFTGAYGVLIPMISIEKIFPESDGSVSYYRVRSELNYGEENEIGARPEAEAWAAAMLFTANQVTVLERPEFDRRKASVEKNDSGVYSIRGTVEGNNWFHIRRSAAFEMKISKNAHKFQISEFEFRNWSDVIMDTVFRPPPQTN